MNNSLISERKLDSKQKIGYHLRQLEERIETFQETKFCNLKVPRNKKSKKKIPTKSVNKTQSPTTEKKINIPISLKPTPMPSFHLPKLESINLGPGCYSTQAKNQTPRIFISNQSRFSNNLDDQLNVIFQRNHSGDVPRNNSIEKRNMELEKFLPENRVKFEKQKSKEREIKGQIHKKTKEIIENDEKKVKEEKYIEKIARHKWKNAVAGMSEFSRLMLIIIASMNVAFVLNNQIENTKVRII